MKRDFVEFKPTSYGKGGCRVWSFNIKPNLNIKNKKTKRN
jgi:hypothetical protein